MTDRPDPRRLDLVTDAMVGAAAKELYEQWVYRNDEPHMIAPMWDSLGSRKYWRLRDARIALEAAAPAIAAKALRDASDALVMGHKPDGVSAWQWLRDRADRIERGES